MYHELVKKVDTIDRDKQNLEKKIEDVGKKFPDTSKFIQAEEYNILATMNFNARMTDIPKNFAPKN